MRGTSSPREKLTGGFADGLGAIAQVRRGLSQRWQLEASRTTRFAFHSEKLAPNFLYSPCRRRSIRLVSLNSGAMFDDERRGGRHGPETHRGPPPKCYTRTSRDRNRHEPVPFGRTSHLVGLHMSCDGMSELAKADAAIDDPE